MINAARITHIQLVTVNNILPALTILTILLKAVVSIIKHFDT